ncbi:MAG: CRISPR-associated endonuclease Cas2 [Acholeplasma sp.]|nr:CRISPR-associated endonuclease Cas2 [Acholeplasma sp.]
MSYDIMRLILFFDLPVKTKKERRVYTKFRKYLISKGYLMLQYSVYSKIFANRDSVANHTSMLRKECPKKGQIRILMLTEKQYSKMEVILGGISKQENIITIDPFILL